jgi:hypothetical protein
VCAGSRPPPPWIAFAGDVSAVPRGASVLLPLHDWRSHQSQWRAHAARVGVVLDATDDPTVLLSNLEGLDAVLVDDAALTNQATVELRVALARRGWHGSWLVSMQAQTDLVGAAGQGTTVDGSAARSSSQSVLSPRPASWATLAA